MSTPSEYSRRDFSTLLAASGAGWMLAAATDTTAAQEKPPKPSETQPPKPDTPAPSAADHALRLLLSRFPDERLDEAAQAALRADLERHAARSRVLASFDLANGDEPAFAFAVYRRPDAPGKQ